MCPSPRFDSILDRLPDVSSLQRQVHPFCPRRWPWSVGPMRRPPPRITMAFLPHPDPLSTSWPVEVNTLSSNAVDKWQTYLPFRKRVVTFCPQRWPGSVCVDHRHELLRLSRPIQALRPSAIPNSMQALGRCSPKSCKVVAVLSFQLSKFFNSRVTCWKEEGYMCDGP